MKQDESKISANDRNFALRLRLLNQAHRDAVERLQIGHEPGAVVWELRDAYRRAHEARPIWSGPT